MNNHHLPLEEKFYARIQKTDNCWIWVGAHNNKGYGHLWVNGKNQGAHRLSWQIHFGPIPEGMVICHHCDNPQCVNPEHLFVGTQKENLADRDVKGRSITGNKHGRYTKPERTARGERCGDAKFTNDQVRLIREQCARGISQKQLAKQFEVDKNTIYRMINRITYKEA